MLAFRDPWVFQDLSGLPAPKEPQEYPDPRASWVMADFQGLKVKLDLRGNWAIQGPMAVLDPWARMERGVPGVMLGRWAWLDLKERREVQETEDSQALMVYLDKRVPWEREEAQGPLALRAPMETRDGLESPVCPAHGA